MGREALVKEIAESLPLQYSRVVEVEGKRRRAYYDYCQIKIEGMESKLFLLSKTPSEMKMGAPCLGEHNEYVCTRILGMTDEDFVEALQSGAFD